MAHTLTKKKKKGHREGNKRNASQRNDDIKPTDRKREPLALTTGGGLFALGAWKEPQESRSHPALVDNLRVTWEIQQWVLWLPRQQPPRIQRGEGPLEFTETETLVVQDSNTMECKSAAEKGQIYFHANVGGCEV